MVREVTQLIDSLSEDRSIPKNVRASLNEICMMLKECNCEDMKDSDWKKGWKRSKDERWRGERWRGWKVKDAGCLTELQYGALLLRFQTYRIRNEECECDEMKDSDWRNG